jgi:hypothetical protein
VTWPLLLVAGMFAVVGLWWSWERLELPGSTGWRARRSLKREQERLRRAPTAELASEARRAVAYEKWERLGPGRALLERDQWTDEDLLQALEALYAAVNDDDRLKGRRFGRGSGGFEFNDCGLASICAALVLRRDRRGNASDPARTP